MCHHYYYYYYYLFFCLYFGKCVRSSCKLFYDNKLLYDLVAMTPRSMASPSLQRKQIWLDSVHVVGASAEEPEHKS